MNDPHGDPPVKTLGPSISNAEKAVILLHGRGASAASMLQMAADLPQDGIAYMAPQAANRTWYPHSFLSPVEKNEPGRSSGLSVISNLVEQAEQAGISRDSVFLGGFSQGACLATEYAARNPDRYGGVFGLSGGLIGGNIDRDAYSGDMERTPVFLGCSDRDPHIPLERVNETAAVFEELNAAVEKRIYDGMGHTVNRDEMKYLQDLLA